MKDDHLAALKQAAQGNLWWFREHFMRKGNFAGTRETISSLVRAGYMRFIVNGRTMAVGAKITPRGREILEKWSGL